MQHKTNALFPELSSKSGIVVADGYGISIRVNRGHLVIADGIGRNRRERRYARATSKLRRLLVLGHAGSISLEALRWLSDLGIGFAQIDRDGTLVASSAGYGLNDARLRRAQALVASAPAGVEIAREILTRKLEGQADVLGRFAAPAELQGAMARQLAALGLARSLDALRAAEAAAAAAYFQGWEGVEVEFARKDAGRVPAHWLTFGRRSSPITGQPRLAANPANAILNYLYALLEAETRLACLAVGLDPGLGIVHADAKARDSLALDVMEAARPAVDAFVLDMLATRVLRAADFHETPQGVCRILPPLTHHLASTMTDWAAEVATVAERVAAQIAEVSTRSSALPTSLTQANRKASGRRKGAPKTKISPRAPRACRSCGVVIAGQNAHCPECRPEARAEHMREVAAVGRRKRADLRARGRDPSSSPEVRRRMGATMSKRKREAKAWEERHGGSHDPKRFKGEIWPLIKEVSLSRMMRATGLSRSYLSSVRWGDQVPHPRHWDALRELGEERAAAQRVALDSRQGLAKTTVTSKQGGST